MIFKCKQCGCKNSVDLKPKPQVRCELCLRWYAQPFPTAKHCPQCYFGVVKRGELANRDTPDHFPDFIEVTPEEITKELIELDMRNAIKWT
jgi:hypothetical protein